MTSTTYPQDQHPHYHGRLKQVVRTPKEIPLYGQAELAHALAHNSCAGSRASEQLLC